MTVLIVSVGIILLFVGFVYFIKALFKVLRAFLKYLWLTTIATEKQVNRQYEKHVVIKTEEYQNHIKSVDDTINQIIND